MPPNINAGFIGRYCHDGEEAPMNAEGHSERRVVGLAHEQLPSRLTPRSAAVQRVRSRLEILSGQARWPGKNRKQELEPASHEAITERNKHEE